MDQNLKHSINWLDSTRRAISAEFPEVCECSYYVTERLSALLLERLPPDLGHEIIELLPDLVQENARSLQVCAQTTSERSIGYMDFVLRTMHVLGCTNLAYAEKEESEIEVFSRRLTDSFLWAVAQEMPPEMKSRIQDFLPAELKSRMNLYSAVSDEAKVA